MCRYLILTMIFSLGVLTTQTVSANGPADTIVASEQVLSELMAIPAKQIPRKLLSD